MAFLRALELSQSINNGSGWNSAYLVIEDNDKKIVAVVPSYLKTNSSGEYVFDYEWANAYQRAGGQYYPKLQISIPYTPVTGRRILIDDACDYNEIIDYISSEIILFCAESGSYARVSQSGSITILLAFFFLYWECLPRKWIFNLQRNCLALGKEEATHGGGNPASSGT